MNIVGRMHNNNDTDASGAEAYGLAFAGLMDNTDVLFKPAKIVGAR